MAGLFFVMRITLAWVLAFVLLLIIYASIPFIDNGPAWPVVLAALLFIGYVSAGAFSHVRRVRLITGRVDPVTLANRQRRQIEIPLGASDAFALVDAAVRELPGVEEIQSARDSLQVRAKVGYSDPYGRQRPPGRFSLIPWLGFRRNQLLATITPGTESSSLSLICEPESGAWTDWLKIDHGANLEHADAIGRAISRRIAESRRAEQDNARQIATDKEVAQARLSLLHAQIEPHFLYNTLTSAQLLTRTDAARADEMLGHLITYLRRSLPRGEEAWSTLGEELERARAYLEIMKIRMGPRLTLQVDVPAALLPLPLPAMMLQTLVENAIKHGLEPQSGGGTIWLLARVMEGQVSITVADDGRGFAGGTGGTGIGLSNVRERLRLLYGAHATLAVVSNFPKGVAATLSVPAATLPIAEEASRA